MNQSKDNYSHLIAKLDEFIRKHYKNLLIRGTIYFFSLALLFYLAVITFEFLGEFDVAMRTVLFWSYLAGNVLILSLYVVVPLLHLYRFGKIISHEQAAVIIGKYFREVQDKLLNILQLKSQQSEVENTFSAMLIEASVNQKINEIKPVPFSSAINLKENRRYLKYAFAPLLLLLVILFASPALITDGTTRLLNYSTRYEKKMPFRFTIRNENLSVPLNEDFDLDVEITGEELPDEVFVVTGSDQHHRMKKADKTLFGYRFSGVNKNVSFKLFASGFYSHEFELTALLKPVILSFRAKLVFPKYLNKKNETVENTGDLVIPSGTQVQWEFTTSNTSELKLCFPDTIISLRGGYSENYFFSRRFIRNEPYSITTSNEKMRSRDTIAYLINVIPDMYPSISAEETPDSSSDKRLYFNGVVGDDYGIVRLTFNYRLLPAREEEEKSPLEKLQITDLPVNRSSINDAFFHFWDMTQMELKPGRQIEYYFEVWDNDGVTGSKSSRTQTKLYRMPTLSELSARAEEENEAIKSMLAEGVKQAQDIRKALDELSRKMLEKKNISWEEKKKMQDLMKQQENLKENIEKMEKENSVNFSKQDEFQNFSREFMEKRDKLEELFEKIFPDEMKELLLELEQKMDQLDKSKLQEMMDKMNLSTKDIEKELDRNLALFKQLEFEQKLEETVDKLKELAKEEEKLAGQSESKKFKNDSLKAKQDELNKQFDEVRKDLEDLQKKNKDLENPQPLEDTKEQEQSIDEEMKKSSEQLGDNKPKKASESQKSASEKMKKMSDKLSELMASMSGPPQEDMQALRQILDNLITLSFDQEALMQNLENARTSDPKYVQYMQEQKKLVDDSKLIEDSLHALSKRVMEIESIVNREISAINQSMDKAISALVGRNIPEARTRQQFAMTSINNLALLLSEALDQMQQQMASKMSGTQQCQKPGSGKPGKPSMSTLRQMQEQLNKQLQQLKDGMLPGGKKGDQGMNMGLAKMAAQQEYIRNEMRKLAQQGNPLDKNRGNIQNLMKMMEQNETDIVNRQISEETVKRQQEILTRLLEAEKAFREREYDNQRKATEAINQEKGNIFQKYQYKYQKSNEIELLKTVPPTLNPYYKNKVTEYFNNL